ncbi:MAG TPA: SEC-C metal-binding domain-containing protein, partial [Solirubrobacterales bacterium]|nr:SEC-C metal-binding domain-containing protein [Solirubrobacterales bacterium]
AYDEREDKLGEELMRHLERSILLQVIDNRWREHLFDMDYLREGIHLRGFAQIDPLVAYKNEGFTMFEDLMHSIWEEFSKLVFHAEIEFTEPAGGAFQGGGFEAGTDRRALEYSGGTMEAQPSALEGVAAGVATGPAPAAGAADMAASQAIGPGGGEVVETVVKDEHDKLGRNDPCWCGSGKKYKKCHGA